LNVPNVYGVNIDKIQVQYTTNVQNAQWVIMQEERKAPFVPAVLLGIIICPTGQNRAVVYACLDKFGLHLALVKFVRIVRPVNLNQISRAFSVMNVQWVFLVTPAVQQSVWNVPFYPDSPLIIIPDGQIVPICPHVVTAWLPTKIVDVEQQYVPTMDNVITEYVNVNIQMDVCPMTMC
jgi:hypothetical protein